VQQVAQELGIKLTQRSACAESVGNNTRQRELEKLRTFAGAVNKHLDVDSVANWYKLTKTAWLAAAIRVGMQPGTGVDCAVAQPQ